MDSHKLLKVIPFIVNNLPDIQSLLVVRNGYLVFENYYGLGMPDRKLLLISGIITQKKVITTPMDVAIQHPPAFSDDLCFGYRTVKL